MLPDGSLVISTVGSVTVGTKTFNREDLLKVSGTSLSFYVDGSDIGLTTTGENIDAVDVQPDGSILVSTKGAFAVPGLSGGAADVAAFRPTQLGAATQGSFSSTLAFAAQQFGMQALNLDGFQVGTVNGGSGGGTRNLPSYGAGTTGQGSAGGTGGSDKNGYWAGGGGGCANVGDFYPAGGGLGVLESGFSKAVGNGA